MGIETQNGNKKQYVDVMLDEERFSRILPYLKAGTKLFVTGEILGVNTWLSKEGKPMGTIKISAFKLDFPPKQRKKEDEDSPF